MSHEAHEGHEGSGTYYISISSFVLFASFVVQCLFRFWLRRTALMLRGDIHFLGLITQMALIVVPAHDAATIRFESLPICGDESSTTSPILRNRFGA